MQATRQIMEQIYKTAVHAKGDMYVSHPVLRSVDREINIAVFLVRRDEKKKDQRPQFWLARDIVGNGKLTMFRCSEKDFTTASYTESFDYDISISEDDMNSIYKTLDSIRQSIIEGVPSSVYEADYSRYMTMLLSLVPKTHKKLYVDLSALSAKTYDIKDVVWEPEKNLSDIPESVFRKAERVAEHIHFLPTEYANEIKYRYPSFCLREDKTMRGDPWQELLMRLSAGEAMKTGHFKCLSSKNTIYTICQKGDKDQCLFGQCPYLIAAYIRYLKDYHTDTLAEQRSEYKKRKYHYDAIALTHPDYNVSVPDLLDRNKLKEALDDMDRGALSVYHTRSGKISVSRFTDMSGQPLQTQHNLIDPDALSRCAPDKVLDIHGDAIDEHTIYMIYAYDLISAGKWEEYFGKDPENKGNTPMQGSTTDSGRSAQKKDEQKSLKPDVSSQTTDRPEPKASEDKGVITGYALRCARECTSFYGVYQAWDEDYQAGISELYSILQGRKLVDSLQKCTLKTLPKTFEERTLYIVTCSESYFPNILRKFYSNRFVLLCGSKVRTESLMGDPIIRSVYGRCMIRKEELPVEEIYVKVKSELPDPLKKEMEDMDLQSFRTFLMTTALPVNRDGIADYIIWKCSLENRLLFKRYAHAKKKS